MRAKEGTIDLVGQRDVASTPLSQIEFKGVETSKTDFLQDWGKGTTSLVVGIATIRKKDQYCAVYTPLKLIFAINNININF